MIEKFNYTDKEISEVLKSIKILIDTREKNNKHILNFFDNKNIKYKLKKLNQGDYSFYIPKNGELNILRDLYFDKEICIERKNSTDELISNFAQDRNRIESEFIRNKGKMILMIEDEGFYRKICNGIYKSKYSKQSALGSYHSFVDRYDLFPAFIDKEYSALFIYMTFYYYLRNFLKH